jgi:hypothetical protein
MWKDPKYKEMKDEIFELLRMGLDQSDAEKITLKMIRLAMDRFFEDLIRINNDVERPKI